MFLGGGCLDFRGRSSEGRSAPVCMVNRSRFLHSRHLYLYLAASMASSCIVSRFMGIFGRFRSFLRSFSAIFGRCGRLVGLNQNGSAFSSSTVFALPSSRQHSAPGGRLPWSGAFAPWGLWSAFRGSIGAVGGLCRCFCPLRGRIGRLAGEPRVSLRCARLPWAGGFCPFGAWVGGRRGRR